MQLYLHLSKTLTAVCILLMPTAWAAAATYYVSAQGSDSASGQFPGAAFRTLTHAFNTLGVGDALYLRSGDSWSPSSHLRLDDDFVTIGAYHLVNSITVIHSPNNQRPRINGQTTVPTRGSYAGLIQVTGANSVVQDLIIENSGGAGIRFFETSFGVARNVKVDWTYQTGIQAYNSDHIEIRGSEVVGFGRGGHEFNEPFFPAGIGIRSSDDVVVADTIVREGWGEGINSFFGSNRVLVENNILFAIRNIGIYIDSTHDIEVRNNMILGTSNSTYYAGNATAVGPGITLNNESYQYVGFGGSLQLSQMAKNVKIYNNLVAGTAIGIAFWGQHPDSRLENVTVAHNTFVDNNSQFSAPDDDAINLEIASNIFMTLSSGNRDIGGSMNNASVQWTSNYWSQGAPNSAMRGAGDIYSGLTIRKTNGWRTLTKYTDVSWTDFQPTSNSQTIGAGGQVASLALNSDYNGAPLSNPPDLGALADGSSQAPDGQAPKPPQLLGAD